MLKFLRNSLVVVLVLAAAVYLFGPREPVDTTVRFDPTVIGADLDHYLAGREARFDDIIPGVEKRIVWDGAAGEKTDLAIVYAHGFSSSSVDMRPVPGRVAANLNANLYFMRLAGHGRTGIAMSEPDMNAWVQDMAEAMEIGRRIGDRVVVLSLSTGGTLSILAAASEQMKDGLAGLALASPNFGPVNPQAKLAYWPFARTWVPMLVGQWREWEPQNELQRKYWNTRYETVAVLPMMALVKSVNQLDLAEITTPALILYSENDAVVSPDMTAAAAGQLGGPVQIEKRVMTPSDTKHSHVIAGDILSPAQTDETVRIVTDWVNDLK
ncbi:MAG: alpha/beta hydrolase [Rhodobacteraceae bacterium]|nr:alpha/beta hydrolase [Paracoccaceae bacterium]